MFIMFHNYAQYVMLLDFHTVQCMAHLRKQCHKKTTLSVSSCNIIIYTYITPRMRTFSMSNVIVHCYTIVLIVYLHMYIVKVVHNYVVLFIVS